jgi:hypothetical protein
MPRIPRHRWLMAFGATGLVAGVWLSVDFHGWPQIITFIGGILLTAGPAAWAIIGDAGDRRDLL